MPGEQPSGVLKCATQSFDVRNRGTGRQEDKARRKRPGQVSDWSHVMSSNRNKEETTVSRLHISYDGDKCADKRKMKEVRTQ